MTTGARKGRFSLATRIDFLAHAISNAKLCTSETQSAYAGEQLQELEEKLDVAKAQLAVAEALAASNKLELVEPAAAWLASDAVLYTVALLHLVGGLMLAAGFMTRLAALIQIPVLLGAVFLVHINSGLFAPSQSLEFSALTLFLQAALLSMGGCIVRPSIPADFYNAGTQDGVQRSQMVAVVMGFVGALTLALGLALRKQGVRTPMQHATRLLGCASSPAKDMLRIEGEMVTRTSGTEDDA